MIDISNVHCLTQVCLPTIVEEPADEGIAGTRLSLVIQIASVFGKDEALRVDY